MRVAKLIGTAGRMKRVAEQDDPLQVRISFTATCVATRPPMDFPPMNRRSRALDKCSRAAEMTAS